MPSRRTPRCASACGSPLPSRSHDEPASRVRYTDALPSCMTRPCPGSSGIVKNVSRSCACAAHANPNSDGSPSVISFHVIPPSSLRHVPTWFCWNQRDLSTGDGASLCTQKPTSSFGGGGQSRRRPLLRGAHVFPPSSVSKMLLPCTITRIFCASSASGMIADSPRWPGGCIAGSFQTSRPGAPSSVERSENVLPPSLLSKSPTDSAPTYSFPCAEARLDTL